jgi:hypothetical protein
MSVAARGGWVVAAIFAAYLIAILTYGSADGLARASHGLWDDGFIVPIRTILVVMTLALMIFFAVQSEDRTIRGIWVFSAVALVAYSAMKTTGLGDPDFPQTWLVHHLLDPLRSMARLS